MTIDTKLDSKRVAKNTLFLYFRMIFIMVISLYTSRVVLETLGVEDFGIYNVVGGVVAMFSVISGSLSAAISRFLTYELGRNDLSKLKVIFSTSVNIQIALSAIIFILAETAGLWFLNVKMNISPDRIEAANWVFQCSIITFVINLISVPYNASIISHEKMSAFAYVSILEVVLKLIVVYLLGASPIDKLKAYALLLMSVALIIILVFQFYCKRNFSECTYHFIFDKAILKQMAAFAGWNFIGAAAGVLRTQGVNIVINLFYGATINAARGISVQVNSAVTSFASNFMTALNPQITKSYAAGDFDYMNKLLFQGARLSFYMLLLLSLPIIVETETILVVWLKLVPEHAVGFVQYILVFAMCEAISGPLITAMLATGNIKKYQIIIGGTNLLNLPVSYLLLKLFGFESFPEITMVVAIVLSFICLLERLWLMRDMINLDSWGFLKQVVFNITLVTVVAAIVPTSVHLFIEDNILLSLSNIVICVLSSAIVIFFVGCNPQERIFVLNKAKTIKEKIIHHGK